MASWTQVDIITSTDGIDPVSAMLAELNLGSIAIQDSADFELFLEGKQGHWDYIDDELMKLQTAPTVVTVYLTQLEQGENQLILLEENLTALRQIDTEKLWGELTFSTSAVQEEDWETAWKQYYHPVEIGERIAICPTWEDYKSDSRVIVKMDPGMAFGTGTHESTRLCLEALDKISKGGERVLDIGCGSGILAVSALLLGAKSADCVDIDQLAVKVAAENAAVNGVSDRLSVKLGSFTQFATDKYDIIFANIVANAIIQLSPDIPQFLAAGGSFITSGIIDTRENEVKEAIEKAGLTIVQRFLDSGWVAFRAQMIED